MQDRKFRACFLSQDCRHAPAQFRLLHRFRRIYREKLRVQQISDVTKLIVKHRETDEMIKKTKTKRKDNKRAAGNRFRDLPEWLQEFADNLEDAEVPCTRKHFS